MEGFQRKMREFIEDKSYTVRDRNPEELLKSAKKGFPAAILASNILASSPATAQEIRPRDPIGDIIRQSEKPTSIDELIRRLESGKDVLDRMTKSINEMPYPGEKTAKEIVCLAKNMWFEAANQGKKGLEAVGIVTLIRVISGKYPKSVCGVVYQGSDKRAAQYSWTPHEKDRDAVPRDPAYKAVS